MRQLPADPDKALPPRERIVQATFLCIERHGIDGATVRRIAEVASVNVAAINYYFGTKDALIDEVFTRSLHEGFTKALGELRANIAAHDGDVERGARVFLTEYIRHAFRYPRLAVAHLRDPLLHADYDGPAAREVRQFIDELDAILAPALPHLTTARRRLAVVHLWATITQLAILPGLFPVSVEHLAGEEMAAVLAGTLFGGRGMGKGEWG